MKYYYIDINDTELGLQAISLVDKPAIEQNFLLFSDEHICFAKDDEKQIISGPALIAEMPIYRRRPDGSKYYVVFQKDVIKQLVERFSKQGKMNSVDLQHNGKLISGIYMIESYFINDARGIRPKEFADIEDGSWIVSYYVEDESLWDKIKNGNDLNGFSISCMANLIEKFEKQEPDTPEDEINKLIDEILN